MQNQRRAPGYSDMKRNVGHNQTDLHSKQAETTAAALHRPAPSAFLPALLGPGQAGEYLGFSRTQFYNLDRLGHIPSPLYIGTAKRWSKVELDNWIEAGCPHRLKWQALREQKSK